MATRRRLRARLADLLVRTVDRLVPPGDGVVVHSTPDLDDTVVALLRGRPAGVRIVVLAQEPAVARARASALGLDGPDGVPVIARHTRAGWWAYLRARHTLTTHGLFGCARRPWGKQVIGLWHGEFGKQIGTFAGEPPRHFDWAPVSGPLARAVRAAEFHLDPARIHVVGSPRQELLTDAPALGPGRHVLWVPTYRTSVRGMARSDGDADALDDALVDPALLALLERHDATLWYRPHPLAVQDVSGLGARVRLATNPALEQEGRLFYEVMGAADTLVTDYSSVWIDHLLTDRPMVAFCPDLDRYRGDRGLALEPHEAWFPGPVVRTVPDLLTALEAALSRPEADAALRADRRRLLHAPGHRPVAATWASVTAG